MRFPRFTIENDLQMVRSSWFLHVLIVLTPAIDAIDATVPWDSDFAAFGTGALGSAFALAFDSGGEDGRTVRGDAGGTCEVQNIEIS